MISVMTKKIHWVGKKILLGKSMKKNKFCLGCEDLVTKYKEVQKLKEYQAGSICFKFKALLIKWYQSLGNNSYEAF